MKANLTKLINDCISLGFTLADKRADTEQAIRQAKSIAIHCLPDDCDANLDDVAEHVQNLRAFAGPEPFVVQVTEFHGKYTVKLSDRKELRFCEDDLVKY